MRPFFIVTLLTGALVAATFVSAQAEQALQLKQLRDNAPAELLSTAEIEALGDPFFEIVLKRHADVTNLREIEDLLQPNPGKRPLFIVHENIANPSLGQVRRTVIAFEGTNSMTGDVLSPNVMISVFFDSQQFPDDPAAIEVWGWDNQRGRYNYYKMDRSGTPALQLTWKFRGSSVDADLLNPVERRGTCLHCHVSGAPIMKELAFPWNNWKSFKFPATYMTQDWPAGSSPRLQALAGAEELEKQFILGAITQFNTRRLNQGLLRRDDNGNIDIDGQGNATVVTGQRLLNHLFATTEVNLISSGQLSGMHPLAPNEPGRPGFPIAIPNTFFLNANLIAGGTNGYQGLGIRAAREFSNIASVQPEEYKRLVEQSGIRLSGRRGDTNFAWFVPEPSHVDNSMVDRLMRRGVVTPAFVAAVQAIDLERPIFSDARASLLEFVPDRFPFRPATGGTSAPHPDPLTELVIARIEAANPAPGSPAREFLSLLRDPDPVERLRERVQHYLDRVSSRLRDTNARMNELSRLFDRAIEGRMDMKRHPVLSALDETGDRLFSLP